MEIFNCVISGTNNPETQEILKNIDVDTDILLTSVDADTKIIEIQYIEPINQVKTIGFVPEEIANEIFEKYGNNANIDIADFLVSYENGVYGLVADIEVDEMTEDDDDEPKEKRLPLPLLIVVGTLTAILTVVLVIIKMVKAFKKKD